MHADNRAIDKHILKVRITRQSLKYTVKHPVLGPAAKPPEDTIPTAEARGQIAPRRTNPHTPQNRLQKKSIILCRHAAVARLARQQGFNQKPRPVRYDCEDPFAGSSPVLRCFGSSLPWVV